MIMPSPVVDQCQIIASERLTDRSVALVVKSRVKDLVKQRGRSEAEELVDTSSAATALLISCTAIRLQRHEELDKSRTNANASSLEETRMDHKPLFYRHFYAS
jgi:hypothetical protein